jgi:hypothetical protein
MYGNTKFVFQLSKAFFIQWLVNERIQSVVRARNPTHITEVAEIVTDEDRALLPAKKKQIAYFSCDVFAIWMMLLLQ